MLQQQAQLREIISHDWCFCATARSSWWWEGGLAWSSHQVCLCKEWWAERFVSLWCKQSQKMCHKKTSRSYLFSRREDPLPQQVKADCWSCYIPNRAVAYCRGMPQWQNYWPLLCEDDNWKNSRDVIGEASKNKFQSWYVVLQCIWQQTVWYIET